MEKVLAIIFLLLLPLASWSQTTETKYYRNKPFDKEVRQDQAKYSHTITTENGTVTTTTRNLQKGQIESSESWKGDEPVGIWVVRNARGFEEADFDFVLAYGEKTCLNTESLNGITNFFKDNEAVAYKAPVVDSKDQDVLSFIIHTLRYPSNARRNGIQGVVELAFTITKEGTIQDIVVTKGEHITLDKEAVRVIRKMKLSSAPLINGEPQEVCVKMPITFRLG